MGQGRVFGVISRFVRYVSASFGQLKAVLKDRDNAIFFSVIPVSFDGRDGGTRTHKTEAGGF
uniref:Uncharacterized protein n=1 Tax=Siphoviridae sp. ctZi05 TaxID=2826385 RepID=A0A8S5N0U7_9CAUD|nr:MAG TPA: hypothetical protein [Siphoviridae sp. ctZi05]